MHYLDLFSGLGGFALGAYWAGMRFDRHYFSEVDPYCVELYQQRFPDAIPLGDIREIDCAKLGNTTSEGLLSAAHSGVHSNEESRGPRNEESKRRSGGWIITGGFPCQDISTAGKGAGIRGSRSGLWFEYWRIIRDLRPRYAIMENVGALTFRGLDVVLGSLAEIGYDAEWQDIRAEDMGAPHRRERIWIVAYPQHPSGHARADEEHRVERQEQAQRDTTKDGAEMADTACQCIDRSRTPGPERGAESANSSECRDNRRVLREDGRNDGIAKSYVGGRADGLHAWMDGWEEGIPRIAVGIEDRVNRLRGLGNSIVPQIAELLFRQIKECIDEV